MSDLYIQEGERMRVRVPDGLIEFGEVVTSEAFLDTFAREDIVPNFEARLEQSGGRIEEAYDLAVTQTVTRPAKDDLGRDLPDGSMHTEFVDTITRVRMTIYKHSRGSKLAAVVRFNPAKPLALDDLQLEPLAKGLLQDLRGAILVTGPTHAGKTYTMSSMVAHINANQQGHIVTIEDPIEIPITPEKCVISQLEMGLDVESFASGVIGSLRQSPIAVMVGEVRDAQTAQAALRVVQGGHFLLAGLHGPDAVGALRAYCSFLDPTRLDQERAQFAQRINGIIYQVLVRSIDGLQYHVACEVISFLEAPGLRTKLALGDYDGLAAALRANEAGTISLNRSLLRLINEGKITYNDAKKATYDAMDLFGQAKSSGISI
ncbi:ATPase, T2SS/T4P/T4SS family [Curvibacter sp. APW13]|uniref:type IV pilus twitching motility protein PilT n=1 Tax=Curvibacter sp. APW13 TaxID=3077236 RepID=UPI0028DDE6BF|nr:ATPase, T2SS/T4P/T4SS family [Curvibacter sp. APW13]MDT8992861.1 ATPase, T2SS/T4P/T4SS family [Curvibacter sp. APW13]